MNRIGATQHVQPRAFGPHGLDGKTAFQLFGQRFLGFGCHQKLAQLAIRVFQRRLYGMQPIQPAGATRG
ncbi:hypothetical protein AA0614_0130 [Komagataeibacter saccharivorans NRIC 0614]|nr:hypothetical protein AA0614_0130 [Komagataeibacter saccharivorans NRIC 0614]